MKIITWNCNGAFRKKYKKLEPFDADILIIQECENPETTKDNAYRGWATNFLWTGNSNHKGLGIFANDKTKIQKLGWQSRGLKFFIPCRVDNTFNLLGVWCCYADSFAYIGQFWKYLQLHQSKFENSMMGGDFNSNAFWDKPRRSWNHSDVVKKLQELKIRSFYHELNREEQGKEQTPTFYFQKKLSKPYHLDYIFGGGAFCTQLKSVEVGRPDQWLALSDHMPIVCEIQI